MENIAESENLNTAKENLETEAIAESDQVTLVAGETLESGRAVVVNSEGQVMHAALGISENDINLAVERLVLLSDDSINMMRYLLPGESYTFTRQTIKPRVLAILSIDELLPENLAIESLLTPTPSATARMRSLGISYRGFSQAHRDEWVRAVQSLNPPKPVSCVGCINYHGQSYGGNKLICAIHPTGVEGDTCGDWERQN